MARFLNTSATNYYLEEMIKRTRERMIIVSPFLRFNDRIKELLEDLDRLKVDVRIVYGKSELAPAEINWLKTLAYVRTSFCHNLHAKCYLNEWGAIVTSMNLYEFSQVNNNEMGVYIAREEEPELYTEVLDEAQRLIRISDEVRLSADKVDEVPAFDESTADAFDKLTTSKVAKARGISTSEFSSQLVAAGLLVQDGGQYRLTDAGKEAGGEFRYSKRHGPYFIWPPDLAV